MDANGEPYDGANQYVIHFAPDEMPPVQAFWSITMYTAERVFVTNPLNRYTLSQRDKLKQNPDRSVDLYLQKDSPGPDKESNWLPAPPRRFTLMLRMYWPAEGSPSVLNGTWRPPVVKQTQMTSVTH
jgi:hypothetical protein